MRAYRHKLNARGDCEKCGDTIRFDHLGEPTCPIPDDVDELRCADVAVKLINDRAHLIEE